VVELSLDEETKAALHKSADAVRELVDAMGLIRRRLLPAEAPKTSVHRRCMAYGAHSV
jgi:hypothetical protein